MTNATPLRGVILLAAAVLLFAMTDVTTKHLTAAYAVPLVVAVRFIVNLLLMLVVLGPGQGRRLYQTTRPWLVVIRALCLVVASLSMGFALQLMPVAESTAIIFLGPILVVLAARPLLGEVIGRTGWIAAILGFAGVMLIVRPGSGLEPLAMVYLSVAVMGMVAYNLLSRVLVRTESPSTLLFYTALVGSICFGAYLPWSIGGPSPSGLDMVLFASMGVTAGTGHFLFTAAFKYAPVSVLAPVNYLQLVWAGLLGWLIFRHVPDPLSIAGMGIVTLSGLIIAFKSSRQPVIRKPEDEPV